MNLPESINAVCSKSAGVEAIMQKALDAIDLAKKLQILPIILMTYLMVAMSVKSSVNLRSIKSLENYSYGGCLDVLSRSILR